jgi:hypothetical protein
LVTVLAMERTLIVEFGPSRSKRFAKALAYARDRADQCTELEPGKYRATFQLDSDPAAYLSLGALLKTVRYWRATEVWEDNEPVSAYHAMEMAWCASFQLKSFGACHWRFHYGVLPRCSVCPLFDAERAIREVLRPATIFVLSPRPHLRDLHDAPVQDWDERADTRPQVPDFVPEEWPTLPPTRPSRRAEDR